MAAGIDLRHKGTCRSKEGGRCNCEPSYQAHVWDARSGKRIRKTFSTSAEAKAWRQDSLVGLRAGTLKASDGRTLDAVAKAWLKAAESGEVRNRSGDIYKPSAVRAYETNLRLHVLPTLGTHKLTAIRRVDLQDLADRLHGEKRAPSTVQGALLPLRAIYRRALARGEVAVNPTTGLELPAIRGGRDRVVSPVEAAALIAALQPKDRPVWATAFYAGLRRGELLALRWEDVDLAVGVIRVCRGWDAKVGEIAPKSSTGIRTVPIPLALRAQLETHWLSGGAGQKVFGQDNRPFDVKMLMTRARDAWTAAKLSGLTLHDCRHTYASFAIAAGVNAKALSTYMGHANIAITLDRYGHLMPGNEGDAASLLDVFLAG